VQREKKIPLETAKRESFEEAKIDKQSEFIKLDSMTTIPAVNIGKHRWSKGIFVVPELSSA